MGGQSSFRQITFGPKHTLEEMNVSYIAPYPMHWGPYDRWMLATLPDDLYKAAMISNTVGEASPRDAWGHVKIPRIEHYESTATPNDEEWFKTNNGTLESYSSFIGVPIRGLDSADYVDYSVTIEVQYFDLSCEWVTLSPGQQFNFYDRGWLGSLWWTENTTERAKLSAEELRPFYFIFWVIEGRTLNCSIETAYVEVEVTCATQATCLASGIRRSRMAHPPVAYTLLGQPNPVEKTNWEELIFAEEDILTGEYLKNPRDPIGKLNSGDPVVPSATHPILLGQMLNAYWGMMNGKATIASRFDDATTWIDNNISWPYQEDPTWRARATATEKEAFTSYESKYFRLARAWLSIGTRRSNIEVFHAHYGWATVLMLSSMVLITASLVPFCVRAFLSRGPDILMNLSSLALRDNPYVALPATGTHLDAADRSRYLRNVRIRFGDVKEGNETGRLAIARMEGDVAPLTKGRKYA